MTEPLAEPVKLRHGNVTTATTHYAKVRVFMEPDGLVIQDYRSRAELATLSGTVVIESRGENPVWAMTLADGSRVMIDNAPCGCGGSKVETL